jgi:hypothetical protein
MTNYAKTENKVLWLKYDFGNELARKWFGDEAIDALPTLTRGKNKGKPKGVLVWTKCTHGGWVKTGAYNWDVGQASGYVMPKGCHFQQIKPEAYSDEVWLDTIDLLKNRAKKEESVNRQRKEFEKDIARAQNIIDCHLELEKDDTAPDTLKKIYARDAKEAEVLVRIFTERLKEISNEA